MLPIRFEDIGPNEILRLIEDRTSERKVLEYKQALNIGPDSERAEFLFDVSSFANASGGDIIFGIADERDETGNATGVPAKITPLTVGNPVAECSRIEQIIESGIEPRIPVVFVKPIEIPERGLVIVIRIGKSWLAPHMVSFKNKSRFYSRNGYGKGQLDVQQIGAAFALQRGLGERLRAWRADRVSKAIAGEGPMPMQGSQMIFHIVSASALTSDFEALPRMFEHKEWGSASSLMTGTSQYTRYNADGFLLTYADDLRRDHQSYLQVFRDGNLEYGDSYQLNSQFQDTVPSAYIEQAIAGTFQNAMRLLSLLRVPDPFFVGLSLIGMKGKQMALPAPHSFFHVKNFTKIFDRDVIICPDVRVENLAEGYPYPTTLLPVVNSMWQAAGLKQSCFIDDDGNWEPGR
jgi:hypothetical protein